MRRKIVGRFGRSNGGYAARRGGNLDLNQYFDQRAYPHAGVTHYLPKSDGKQRDSGLKSWAKSFRPGILLFHVFADGFGAAAVAKLPLGNLPRAPCVGHLRVLLLQVAIRFLPALVPCLSVEFAHLASGITRRIAGVGSGRRIDQLADHDHVNRIFAIAKPDKFGQRQLGVAGDQYQFALGHSGKASDGACRRMRCRRSTGRRRRDADR